MLTILVPDPPDLELSLNYHGSAEQYHLSDPTKGMYLQSIFHDIVSCVSFIELDFMGFLLQVPPFVQPHVRSRHSVYFYVPYTVFLL